MKAWEQLSIIMKSEKSLVKNAYNKWLDETEMNDEVANTLLFSLPESAAIALLEVHMIKNENV